MPDGLARFLRTLFQAAIGLLITGGFDALFAQLNRDIPAAYQPYLAIAFTLLVAAGQNYGESHGIVKPMLKREPAPDVPVGTASLKTPRREVPSPSVRVMSSNRFPSTALPPQGPGPGRGDHRRALPRPA